MFNSFFIYLISFLFFSGNFFSLPNLSEFNYGDPEKIENSQYFLDKINKLNIPEISASSAVVMDMQKNIFILEKNPDQVWPIASISKLMSALVLLDDLSLDLNNYYKIKNEDRRVGGKDYLFLGEEVKNEDLLALSLIASDNTAIVALISSAGLTEDQFVELMNEKAKKLNLKDTFFYDATGLNPGNVSTAREVSFLIRESFGRPEIVNLIKNYNYSITTKQGKVKKIYSTNELLNDSSDLQKNNIEVIGGKTGFNDLSGYCLGVKFSINNKEFISVVLNSVALKNRFIDTEKLIYGVYDFYNN